MASAKLRRRRARAEKHNQGRRALPPSLLQALRREAKAFGLSTADYLRLVTAVSAALRRGLSTGATVDGPGLFKWVEHPLFEGIIGWLSKSLADQVGDKLGQVLRPSRDASSQPSNSQPSNSQPTHSPPRDSVPDAESADAAGNRQPTLPPAWEREWDFW